LAKRDVSLLYQGKGGSNQDPEGDEPPPDPDQDLESNWILQERI